MEEPYFARKNKESVRRNLMSESGKSQERRSHRATKTRKARPQSSTQKEVPVLVRGGVYGVPMPQRQKTKARRRKDVALNVPGAEIRLPSLPAIQFGWRALSGFLALMLAGMLYYAWYAPYVQVQRADISGLNRLNEDEINLVLGISGQPIFLMDPKTMETLLKDNYPEFTSVDVRVEFPNKVHVKVEERQPILLWKQDDNSVMVDASGFAFPIRESNETAPTLVVEANDSPSVKPSITNADVTQARFMDVDMVSAIVSMSAVVPANIPILYDQQHGLGWKDKRGWDVFFGDAQDIDMKLSVYQALVKKLKQEKIEPVLISVEFVHAPYYRLEQ
jgi:cell division protein FtsQ